MTVSEEFAAAWLHSSQACNWFTEVAAGLVLLAGMPLRGLNCLWSMTLVHRGRLARILFRVPKGWACRRSLAAPLLKLMFDQEHYIHG